MENTVEFNEIEEVENIEQDAVNAPEESNSAALLAGMIGGFLAYTIVNGGKKLVNFARTKIAEHKEKGVKNGVVDTEYTQVTDEQEPDENEDI